MLLDWSRSHDRRRRENVTVTPSSLHLVAAARYGLRPRQVRQLARHVVRLDADDGQRYALRCTPIAARSFGDVGLELAWTEALRRETDVEPPEAVPGADGELVQLVDAEHGEYDCVLFRWLPGVELKQR